MDGNYLRTLEMRLNACDTVFFLDYPLEVCLQGVESRIGRQREDMPWVETEFDQEFRQWILDFPREQRPEICRLLEKYREEEASISFMSGRMRTVFYINCKRQMEREEMIMT